MQPFAAGYSIATGLAVSWRAAAVVVPGAVGPIHHSPGPHSSHDLAALLSPRAVVCVCAGNLARPWWAARDVLGSVQEDFNCRASPGNQQL